jgi:hypothetical protein
VLLSHHPILMDFGIIGGVDPPDPSYEPARHAMGDTLRFAERMNLLELQPRDDLSSTGYALANPGHEYLVLQPTTTADPFTVRLAAGTYTVEWFSVDSRQTVPGDGEPSNDPRASASGRRSRAPAPSSCTSKRSAGDGP